MKYLLMLSTLSLSLMFSAGSWAEWTGVAQGVGGYPKLYVDFKRIQKNDGLVYYWELQNLLEPTPNGTLSFLGYYKGDCKIGKRMMVSMTSYKLQMGEGDGRTWSPKPQWDFLQPKSSAKMTQQAVCDH